MLSIDRLSHVYASGTRALSEVSLEIGRGMFGLLGPNGAGKSTLMRCLATLQIPSAGAIRFDDVDVLREPQRLRAQLGYLPQDFGVYPRVSALEMLDHLAILKGIVGRGERRAAVEAAAHAAHLAVARVGHVAQGEGVYFEDGAGAAYRFPRGFRLQGFEHFG